MNILREIASMWASRMDHMCRNIMGLFKYPYSKGSSSTKWNYIIVIGDVVSVWFITNMVRPRYFQFGYKNVSN